MFARHEQEIKNYIQSCLDRYGGACWRSICGCLLMHSCGGLSWRKAKTGMPSYRLRGCQTNQGAQDGNHICPVQLSSAIRSASVRSFKVLRASRSSSTARTSSCRDNVHEPVENNEPTLSTLIWQMMELKETLKLWMLFQVISSPCLEFMKGTISVDLSGIHRLHMRNGTKSQKRC